MLPCSTVHAPKCVSLHSGTCDMCTARAALVTLHSTLRSTRTPGSLPCHAWAPAGFLHATEAFPNDRPTQHPALPYQVSLFMFFYLLSSSIWGQNKTAFTSTTLSGAFLPFPLIPLKKEVVSEIHWVTPC